MNPVLKELLEKAYEDNKYEFLLEDYNNLVEEYNKIYKGIDELLKKYEDEITIYTESTNLIDKIITDLKKLKGE